MLCRPAVHRAGIDRPPLLQRDRRVRGAVLDTPEALCYGLRQCIAGPSTSVQNCERNAGEKRILMKKRMMAKRSGAKSRKRMAKGKRLASLKSTRVHLTLAQT